MANLEDENTPAPGGGVATSERRVRTDRSDRATVNSDRLSTARWGAVTPESETTVILEKDSSKLIFNK